MVLNNNFDHIVATLIKMRKRLTKYGFQTTENRSRIMSKIKSSNTTCEILLRKALWNSGIRYRIKSKLIGKPDIVLNKYKLAVFVDGEFWHGYNWSSKKQQIKGNRKYWVQKIEGNMKRDRIISAKLEVSGWTVLRFWERQVKKDVKSCVNQILNRIKPNSL